MRQIVLDTETTGLDPRQGHRIIEIGALEMVDRQLTGKTFHTYINPEREIEQGALEVHGITEEFLHDNPRFAEISDDLMAFVEGAELVIHNAPFDVGFIDNELVLTGHQHDSITAVAAVLDTLELAKDLHPGQRNNLDALCKRYDVDNSSRTLHGALLDAEILADVYLAMTGGQVDLGLSLESPSAPQEDEEGEFHAGQPALFILKASEEELLHHELRLKDIEKQAGHCLYRPAEEGPA
ncbi:MAG: DNA polymerase III subunit epsilon [Gammaproteobacteria bacterium]|nr:DNA polymerase III subunit epsilon [Gammaproteobacteria bacterium]